MIPPKSRVGLALLVWAVSLHSQTAGSSLGPATTLKTSLRLVLVDVVVSDDKGAAVPGLHKEDFEILEDGPKNFWRSRSRAYRFTRKSMSPKNMYTCAPACMIFARTPPAHWEFLFRSRSGRRQNSAGCPEDENEKERGPETHRV
jgi:hypothetical protein